jgi:hypothetical protein
VGGGEAEEEKNQGVVGCASFRELCRNHPPKGLVRLWSLNRPSKGPPHPQLSRKPDWRSAPSLLVGPRSPWTLPRVRPPAAVPANFIKRRVKKPKSQSPASPHALLRFGKGGVSAWFTRRTRLIPYSLGEGSGCFQRAWALRAQRLPRYWRVPPPTESSGHGPP